MIANPTKATLAAMTITSMTVLLAMGRIDTDAGIGIIGTICGYVVGNGVGSRTGSYSPIISRRDHQEDQP